MDKYMEAEPYIPLPKQRVNQPLVFDQFMMLWIIWVGGLTAGILAFFGEFIAGHIPKDQKKLTTKIGQDSVIHPMALSLSKLKRVTMTDQSRSDGGVGLGKGAGGEEEEEDEGQGPIHVQGDGLGHVPGVQFKRHFCCPKIRPRTWPTSCLKF